MIMLKVLSLNYLKRLKLKFCIISIKNMYIYSVCMSTFNNLESIRIHNKFKLVFNNVIKGFSVTLINH